MQRSLIRTLAVVSLVLLAGTVAFAGGAAESSSATTDTTEMSELGTYPIVSQPATISVVRLQPGPFYDHETNWFTDFYEEKTNVRTEVIPVPGEQFKERVNLMFASGDQIDLIVTANNGATIYTKSEQMQLYNQGVVYGLNDLIDDHTMYLKAQLDSIEGWRDFITGPDGNIYGLPYINECFHCTWYNKMWINTVWLENLGLEIPTTPDEFYEMLKAFKENDANDNGDPTDEIPLSASVGASFTWLDGYLMSAFIYSDGQDRLLIDDGTVVAAFAQPEYREGLRYLNKLFSEGLIYPESFVQDRGTHNQLNSQKYESIIGASPGPHHGYTGSRPAGETPRWFEYLAIKPLIGPEGVQTTRWDYYNKFGQSGGVAGFIPKASTNPELVMRFLDWMYTDEGSMIMFHGGEDIGWEKAAPGEVGLEGQPATWKPIQMQEGDEYFGNSGWGANFPAIMTAQTRAGIAAPDSWYSLNESGNPIGVEKFLHELTKTNYAPYGESLENVVPPLFFPIEDIEELSQLKANLYPYVNEAMARFTVGDMDVEGDWDRHIRELDNLGLQRYLQLVQKAYDMSAFAN